MQSRSETADDDEDKARAARMNSSSSRRPGSGRSLRARLLQLDLEYGPRVQVSRATRLLTSTSGLVANPRKQECTCVEMSNTQTALEVDR